MNRDGGMNRTREPGWFLELDELAEPPFATREPVALSELVRPMKLDPVAIAADETYWARVKKQRNLPAEVAEGL